MVSEDGVGVTSFGAGWGVARGVDMVVSLLVVGFVFVEVFFFQSSAGVAFFK